MTDWSRSDADTHRQARPTRALGRRARSASEDAAALGQAIEELLRLTAVPLHAGAVDALDRVPPDLASRLFELVRHAATLPRTERFATQEQFDVFLADAAMLGDAQLMHGLRRLPRDSLESVAAYFVRGFAERDAEARRLFEEQQRQPPPAPPQRAAPPPLPSQRAASPRLPRSAQETVCLSRRAIEEVSRRDALLEARTARIDELLRRVSELEREREEVRAVLQRLDAELRAAGPAPVAGRAGGEPAPAAQDAGVPVEDGEAASP